jgi:hypothetical protein
VALAFNGKGGGGSSSAVYSWLGSYLHTAISGAVSATAVWDQPADALVGSDLSISGDGQTISYLTTGLYVVSLYVSATSTAPPSTIGFSPVFANPAAGTYWYVSNTDSFLRVDAALNCIVTHPPAKVVAGDSMTVTVNGSANMTLGTGTTLWVARIA